jgi:hypothetical protein
MHGQRGLRQFLGHTGIVTDDPGDEDSVIISTDALITAIIGQIVTALL